uniref:Uncharacterized protein n=1 Tax=Arundo donax TaxID=35708 RepID=A0A0A8ZN30_ARUDO
MFGSTKSSDFSEYDSEKQNLFGLLLGQKIK